MNANCIICSDFFIPTSEVYSTGCGHLFHYHCLIQWIERSRTCPQCRAKTTEKTIHRVYFNLANSEGITDDVGTLQFKLDNIQFQIKMKDKELSNLNEKYEKIEALNVTLREEIRELENGAKVSESAIHALKQQIIFFKQKSKEGELLAQEVRNLKEKLRILEDMKIIHSGSFEEVKEMLKTNSDPQALALMVATLKKELTNASRTKLNLTRTLNKTQNDLSICKKERTDLRLEIAKLTNNLNEHKNCDSEKIVLKRKLVDLEKKLADSTNLNAQSPSSLRKQVLEKSTMDSHLSPTVAERVQHIKDSTSPYLMLNENNSGFKNLMTFSINKTTEKPNPFSIFKTSVLDDKPKVSQTNYTYDGLGGHVKDEKFPTPSKGPSGIKRSKSVSISTNKFKKLAPNSRIFK